MKITNIPNKHKWMTKLTTRNLRQRLDSMYLLCAERRAAKAIIASRSK